MSALRRLILRPEPYLAMIALAAVLVSLDAMRPPRQQITAGWYVAAVHGYQHFGRPLSKKWIRCRYQPTCSEYSAQAVEKYGLARGLVMTVRRLTSCRGSVKMGTSDPVAHRSSPPVSSLV